jgi:hypothetical protein
MGDHRRIQIGANTHPARAVVEAHAVFGCGKRLKLDHCLIVIDPDYEQVRLFLAHPCMPFRLGFHVGSIVVEQALLNIRLPELIEQCKDGSLASHRQNDTELCVTAHHTRVGLRRFFERIGFNHGAYTG